MFLSHVKTLPIFTFARTEFHLPFYYPITQFLELLLRAFTNSLTLTAVNNVMSATGYANSLFTSFPKRVLRVPVGPHSSPLL